MGTLGGGLNRWEGDGFTSWRHADGDPRQPRQRRRSPGLAPAPGGGLWIGTENAGLDLFEPAAGAFRHYRNVARDPSSLRNDVVQELLVDRAGRLWVGTLGGGVSIFDPAREKFASYNSDPLDPNSLGNNFISSILPDADGRLWVGSWGGGLDCLDRRTGVWTHHVHDPADPGSLADNVVLVPAPRPRRPACGWAPTTAWTGSIRGLGRFRHYPLSAEGPGLPRGRRFLVLYEDRAGRIWSGADPGLNCWDPATGEVEPPCPRSRRPGHA